MLIKFETKSARVKGLSFHSNRPWILASLHTGVIVLWDYQLKNQLDKFEGHDGPVRGLDFHKNQPLFVSGGDDYRIKVWNYQLRRCLFTLLGHLDYIRSTTFHPKHPWVLSASDDQTVRIWNWQSRQKLAILTGHNHYVMCAQFHPTEDRVVSASLDQTVRVWDISGLVKRHTSAIPPDLDRPQTGGINVDIFGEGDCVTRHVLEGHDKGVNWVTFHHSLPLILTGADDRLIKLWRVGENRIWEVHTFRGHYNNVSAVLFHPRQPLILSVSEDKSVRAWDMTRHTSLQTYRRAFDRFWMVASHPTKNLFCAGHDSGLMIFKLERERPAWTMYQNTLLYIKDRYLRRSNVTTGQDVSIMRLKGEGRPNYATIAYNPAENSVLLNTYDSSYELYVIPEHNSDPSKPPDSPRDWKKSTGKNACWLGRNRFVVLQNESHLLVKTTKNEVSKKIQMPFACLNIFPAGTGMILIQQQPTTTTGNLEGDKGTTLILFDIQQKSVVTKIKTIGKIKQVVWSTDRSRVALLGKSTVMLCNRKLEVFSSWVEVGKIKSGAWKEPSNPEIGMFIYNTSAHLKYALTNGDNGTIRTMDAPIYIISVSEDQVLCLDREAKVQWFKMDQSEPLFKLALSIGNYSQVIELIQSCKLVGQAIISYLHKKGFPEIALHFLEKQDERTRFELALECGNIDVAVECARALDVPAVWNKLAEMALLLGNHQTAELCYQRTRNVAKLAFLYLITGNQEKMQKLKKIPSRQGNSISSQFWMALVSGDVEGLAKVLEGSAIGKMLTACNLCPPPPLLEQKENWPLLTVSKTVFGTTSSSSSLFKKIESQRQVGLESGVISGGAWEDAADEFHEIFEEGQQKMEEAGSGWDDEADLVLPSTSTESLEKEGVFFVVPSRGVSTPEDRRNAYRLPLVHVLSGNFESAAQLLNEQLGVINLAPFRNLFLNVYQRSCGVYTPSPNLPGLKFYPEMRLSGAGKKERVPLPQACQHFNLEGLLTGKLKGCYELVTKGQFPEAVEAYRDLLLSIPLTWGQSKAEVTKALELVSLCKEYILGLQMELFRKALPKETASDQRRSLELAAYFTHFSLDNVHLMLALRTAMNLSYKLGYFKNSVGFAKRLLELGASGELVSQARKILKASENKSNSVSVDLEYDEQNPFSVCGKTYKPIYRGKREVKCGFCGAAYLPEFGGKLCEVCTVAEIGKTVQGLKISQSQFR